MIVGYITTQCATELIGRNMTLTKPLERTSLGDENFKILPTNPPSGFQQVRRCVGKDL